MKGMLLYVFARLDMMRNQRGATAVEYGIMVALIAAVIITVVAALGQEILGAFQKVVDQLPFEEAPAE
jgi:pilus assembly protein Flp/PilA